jgi:hypothetical protein
MTDPLPAPVVISAHGELFVLVPDGDRPQAHRHDGSPLTVQDLRELHRGTGGGPLTEATVRALAVVKRVFPGASIVSVNPLQGDQDG